MTCGPSLISLTLAYTRTTHLRPLSLSRPPPSTLSPTFGPTPPSLHRTRHKKGVVKATAWTKRANNHSKMKGSVDAKKRSVGQFVKHLGAMGIKARSASLCPPALPCSRWPILTRTPTPCLLQADASAMPNLKTRTLPGAPGPRMIVRGRGDDERAAARGGGRVSRGVSADASMDDEAGVVRMRSRSVPRDRSMTRRDSASIARSQSPARVGLRDATQIKKVDSHGEKVDQLLALACTLHMHCVRLAHASHTHCRPTRWPRSRPSRGFRSRDARASRTVGFRARCPSIFSRASAATARPTGGEALFVRWQRWRARTTAGTVTCCTALAVRVRQFFCPRTSLSVLLLLVAQGQVLWCTPGWGENS